MDRKEVKGSKTGLVPLSESLVTQDSFTVDTENVHRSYNPLKNSETSTLFKNYPKMSHLNFRVSCIFRIFWVFVLFPLATFETFLLIFNHREETKKIVIANSAMHIL